LLVLRATIAAALAGQALVCLQGRNHSSGLVTVMGLLLLANALCVLAGFLTPLLTPLAALECVAVIFSWLPVPAWTVLDNVLAIAELVSMCVAVSLLGPGAFSVDARLFGWREIVIPRSTPPSARE
jgi:uncharacterized membrane protein YphA (DoxX/SURF4 family)